jgi:amidophosphoribosyltransferase
MSDKPREYCGIYGIFNHPEAALHAYYGLHALQHRGQESAGIVTSYFDEEKGRPIMPSYKDFGLVLNVFRKSKVFEKILIGNNAIGHNRYSTSGSSKNPANIQPFRVHYRNGNLAIGHNGNLTNAKQIRERFRKEGVLFQSTSDTELILHLISHSEKEDQMEQIMDALHQIEGAYCLVLLTDDKLIAVRDPNGFRPLALGIVDGAYCVTSETCAFDINNAEYIRDVQPGEVVVIDKDSTKHKKPKSYFIPPKTGTGTSQCIFEYVYFSRPDSMIFGEMVDKIRRNLGKQLAKEHPLSHIITNNTTGKKPVIISVPDSSNTAALGYASESKKMGHDCKYDIGLIRNHYVGRTFISPGQKSREQKVRTKFNPVRGVIEGRPVIIVDDSIVRGTTSRYLVNMIRECNPAEIHFIVSSPPIISPCYYGMDFPSPDELIANKFDRDIDKMAQEIGVDSLRYLSAEGLVSAVKEANPSGHDYCTACFTGDYPVPVNFGVEKEENELT